MWSIWFSWETNLTHKRWLPPTDGESDFLPLQVFFFRVWHNTGFCDKSIVFLLLAQNLGDASQACYQSTLISRMSFFIQWYLPLSGRSTICETLLQALFSSAPHGFAARLCLLAQLTLLAQIGELARRLCINESLVHLFNGSDKFETGQK